MHLFRVFLVAVLTSAMSLSASAQVSWTLESSIWSSYVLGDVGKKAYRGPGQQTSVTAAHANGCFTNVWWWRAYSDGRGFNPSEVDYTFGCSIKLDEYVLGASITYIDLPQQFESYGDVVQAEFSIQRPHKIGNHVFTPYVKIKPTVPLGFNSGTAYEAGIRDVWKLSESLTLTLGARALYETGAYGNEAGTNLRFDAILTHTVNPAFDLNVGVRQFVHLSNYGPGDVRHDDFVFWAGVALRR